MQPLQINLRKYINQVPNMDFVSSFGKVTKVVGLVIEAEGVSASVGELCRIITMDLMTGNQVDVDVEVVGFEDEKLLLMPLGNVRGIRSGDRICCYNRQRISERISTGIRAIDSLLTVGKGQRVGIFSGSGVGKSRLLGQIARYAESDVNVIALVGERGREVREFVEDSLGEEGLKRSVVVAATSDQPPLLRVQGAVTATTIAEYFRDQGANVILMMDSVTRFSMAQREIGLSVGEPPTTRGYTPSVFAKLPALMERAGTTSHRGSITGFYTVLVEGDDINDPIGDTARSILDGHIVLSRTLASQNHYPAIDVSLSLSRLMRDIAADDQNAAAGQFRQVLADYEEIRDAYNIGAYTVGMNPKSDYAIEHIDAMNEFLRQGDESSTFEETLDQLSQVFSNL